MDLGFDPIAGGVSGAAAFVARFVLYPVVQLRRRKRSEDDGTGPYIVPKSLHTPVVISFCAVAAGIVAAATREPVLPNMAAACAGVALAHAVYGMTKPAPK